LPWPAGARLYRAEPMRLNLYGYVGSNSLSGLSSDGTFTPVLTLNLSRS
jgi:hypothetical protein